MSNMTVLEKETVWDMLNTIERGELVHDIEAACQDVVMGVQDTQKTGSVTITLTFKSDPRLGAIRVAGELKVKTPKRNLKEALFFPTPNGNLSRYDSRQRDMFREGQEAQTINHDPTTGEVHD